MPYAKDHLQRVAQGIIDIVARRGSINSDMVLAMLGFAIKSQISRNGNINNIPGMGTEWLKCFINGSVDYKFYNLQPSDFDLMIGSPDSKAPVFGEFLLESAAIILAYAWGYDKLMYAIEKMK